MLAAAQSCRNASIAWEDCSLLAQLLLCWPVVHPGLVPLDVGLKLWLKKGHQCLEMSGMERWRAEEELGLKAVMQPEQLQGLG